MSWAAAEEPQCQSRPTDDGIETAIHPKPKDIGAFEVKRALPSRERKTVGPFVFFDEMGPAVLPAGVGMDVRPHPHVNLATVTYLFEGAIQHRDSLGTNLVIKPGAVNLMVAGRGIVHSERSPPEARPNSARLHGLQLWMGLPQADEEVAPAFHHVAARDIPQWTEHGTEFRLLMGALGGHRSPVPTFSETLYVALKTAGEADLSIPYAPERGLYVIDGEVQIGEQWYAPGTMVVLRPSSETRMKTRGPTRCALIGGAPLGPRYMYWNFVSSRKERIEQAKKHWAEQRFDLVPGDEEERIPLP